MTKPSFREYIGQHPDALVSLSEYNWIVTVSGKEQLQSFSTHEFQEPFDEIRNLVREHIEDIVHRTPEQKPSLREYLVAHDASVFLQPYDGDHFLIMGRGILEKWSADVFRESKDEIIAIAMERQKKEAAVLAWRRTHSGMFMEDLEKSIDREIAKLPDPDAAELKVKVCWPFDSTDGLEAMSELYRLKGYKEMRVRPCDEKYFYEVTLIR